MLQKVIDTLLGVPPWLALLIIAGLVFGEAALFFGFVLPGETAVVYGGVLAAAGNVSVFVVLAVVIVAAVVGDSVGFEVGRTLGPRLVRAPLLRRYPERIDAAQGYLRRRGGRAVVAGRFTAFLRAVMPAMAGASRMAYPRFLVFNAVGGVLWGTACVLLGYFAAHSISRVTHYLGLTSTAIATLLALGLIWAWHRRNRDGSTSRDSAPSRPHPPTRVRSMSATPSSYSITMRLHTAPDHGVVGAVATAIASAGGIVTAIDVADSSHERLVVDVTCSASDADHSEVLVAAVSRVEGVEVHKVSDRTFLLHIGGKIEVHSKVPLRTRDDLSMAYTPGVGRVSLALANNPDDVRRLTIKGNSVAVVTDGSAVLGLGNIGPGAALPVMEGKAALFKRFADIDAWPICLASQDTDEIVKAVEMIAPGFGGINLEDIAAPRCFEVERRLRESLDIPVFHDDQHGTAIVVLAALTNALRCVDKKLPDVRIVVSGAGAAGSAIVTLLLAGGAGDVVVCDKEGVLCDGDDTLSPAMAELASRTNPHHLRGGLHDALTGADVFIGVSAPGILPAEWIADMAPRSVVFALANPDPEVDPADAERFAAVVASGRSDFPNQINNVLAFPGVFRGLLDARAHEITIEMLLKAAEAIAHVVKDDELNPNFIIPSVFNPDVPKAVAAAIRGADA